MRRWYVAGILLVIAATSGIAGPRSDAVDDAITSYEGVLSVVTGDPRPGTAASPRTTYWLTTDAGSQLRLNLDRVAPAFDRPLQAFDRQGVIVHASPMPTGDVSVQALDWANPLTAVPDARLAPPTGIQRWANLLCKFADSAGFEPQTRAWFDALVGFDEPQLGHYWRDVSYGQLDISGSVSYGWYVLPRPREAYFDRYADDGGAVEYLRMGQLLHDCTAQADPHVDFNDIAGINMMFNGELDGYAWGGSWSLPLDGDERSFGVTWLPIWGYQNQAIIAHEMGHGMGLMHSSGPYESPYDSMWDLMSGGGTCNPPHPPYGCVGVHPIAHHKAQLGWIQPDALFVAERDGHATIALEPLAAPSDGTAYLMALVPIQGSPSHFYTIEARERRGYDRRIPGDGIIIHHVNANRWERAAQVVDPDGNYDPNDDGARWTPGETFADRHGGVTISVDNRSGSVYTVTITVTSAFQRTWGRVDNPVAARATDRTWMWGPAPFRGPLQETYFNAPGAQRTVLYYDKSRMEINQPDADSTSIWYVTNGLLATELITGRMQLADGYHEQYDPAEINVAGDPDDENGPTYASFRGLLAPGEPPSHPLTSVLRRDGSVYTDERFAGYGIGVTEPVNETGHVVAAPFWQFMIARGVVWEDHEFRDGPLFPNPYYATGFPVTAPYWTTVRVGGTPRDVLVQCFQRRCLTWTPDNPSGWQVEAGNVGLHYYEWRYTLVPAGQP